MRRLSRSPEKFEVIDLFASLGSRHCLTLDGPAGKGSFVDLVKKSFDKSSRNPALLHGIRTQSMFMYVVASLGRASLIKQEDSGEILAVDNNLKVPDLFIALPDGSNFLVEVKNWRRQPKKPLIFKREYLEALERYSSLVDRPLRFAVYWSLLGLWTLVSAKHIPRENGQGYLDIKKAMKINEMADLGDMQIGTKPPLIIRILTDPAKPRDVDENGRVDFTIGGVDIYCGGKRIESKEERNLAFYFMLYGHWNRIDHKANVREGTLIHVDIEVNVSDPVENQGFEMLGFLSSMISLRFTELTAPDGKIQQLTPNTDPDALGVVIPKDYNGKDLPLWRFQIKPNYE
jgi:hypothetical protein